MGAFRLLALLLALLVPSVGLAKSARAINVTHQYEELVSQVKAGKNVLPADAQRYDYVVVKGLFGNLYPRYLQSSVDRLKSRGLNVTFAPVNTQGSAVDNAQVIEKMVREAKRPIVFIGHSKGVTDTSDAISALAKKDPALVKKNVRAFVAMQGPYKGTPIANHIMNSKLGRAIAGGLAKLIGADLRAGDELTTRAREAKIKTDPFPVDLVPTVAVAGRKFSPWSLFGPTQHFMESRYRLVNDGLVPARSATIPGGAVVYDHLSHAQTPWGELSAKRTEGLVSLALKLRPPSLDVQ